MDNVIEVFWQRLNSILSAVATQLLDGTSEYKFQIGSSSNSAFPLRAYLTILENNESEELSITVDVKAINDGLLIESDVVGDSGVVVLEGPMLHLAGDLVCPQAQIKLDEWFMSFEKLLAEKLDVIKANLSNIK